MRVIFSGLGAYGHLYPLLPLAAAAQQAGHEVIIATGPPVLGRISLPTAAQCDPSFTLQSAASTTRERHPDARGEKFTVALFGEVISEAVFPTMSRLCESWAPDLVVYEAMDAGAGLAASLAGVPAVAYAISLAHFMYTSVHDAAVVTHRSHWTNRGQEPPTLLAAALLDPSPPSMRGFGGVTRLPSWAVRPVSYPTAGAVPEWFTKKKNRPQVYATLGTVDNVPRQLRRLAEAAGSLDADVFLTVGRDVNAKDLGVLPANVTVDQFVSQSAVLKFVDVVVHHGGTGTMFGALEAGVPQVIIPQGADQFLNGDIVTAVGAGRTVTKDWSPETIRLAVEQLVGNSPERRATAVLQRELLGLPTLSAVIDQLGRLVAQTR